MNVSLTEYEFHNGSCDRAYELLGVSKCENVFVFRVWAPNAKEVYLTGDFNFWNLSELKMCKGPRGVWEVRSEFAKEGQRYKYFIVTEDGRKLYKNDPYAFVFAPAPDKSSVVSVLPEFEWSDSAYRFSKTRKNVLHSPVNIYEVHLGSWRRDEKGGIIPIKDLAEELTEYVKRMGYTHIELMPVTEFPYEPSWGYQVTGYFAPCSGYGSPEDFMCFIDLCHRKGIGVILDWVPAHFPKDEEALFEFDGQACYEVGDPKMNEHPDWNTRIFDFGKGEVRSFLISSALFWLREYHFDGIRVDAVASMLYLDYGRKEFTPNKNGTNENLEAIEFLRILNQKAFAFDPSVMMIAEESTAFPMVTRPAFVGGLGFNFKWNMGWMNDTLRYMQTDPLFRKGIHNTLTFGFSYAYSENFILPLSHDEVVHGKKSLIEKMPGDYEAKFDELRLLAGFMFAHPGKKLSFMGNEFAQFIEWDYGKGLDWMLLDYPAHAAFKSYIRDLNRFYLKEPCLWEVDFSSEGLRWISADDRDQSVLAFIRENSTGEMLLCIFNFCPIVRYDYKIGLPEDTAWRLVFTSDRKKYGGAGIRLRPVVSEHVPMHGYPSRGSFILPPLSASYYKTIQ